VSRGRAPLLTCAAALAAACGGDTAPRDGAPVDSGTRPAPAAEQPAEPSGWTVTADGYGPVQIGMSLESVRNLLGALLVPRESLSTDCDYLAVGPDGPDVLFMVVAGRLVRIDVRDSAVTTSEGARIGDSEAMIGRRYGADRVMSTPHAYTDGHYLTVAPPGAGDDHRLVFETDGRSVTEFRAGLLPMVGWVEGCS
jgi:hypothetical protein